MVEGPGIDSLSAPGFELIQADESILQPKGRDTAKY